MKKVILILGVIFILISPILVQSSKIQENGLGKVKAPGQLKKLQSYYYEPISDIPSDTFEGWHCQVSTSFNLEIDRTCSLGKFDRINDGVRQPLTPSITQDYLFKGRILNPNQIIGFQTPIENHINSITLWVYSESEEFAQHIAELKNDGTIVGSLKVGSLAVPSSNSPQWRSVTWNFPTNIGELTLKLHHTYNSTLTNGIPSFSKVYAAYLEVKAHSQCNTSHNQCNS